MSHSPSPSPLRGATSPPRRGGADGARLDARPLPRSGRSQVGRSSAHPARGRARLDACPLHPERGERWRREAATERGISARPRGGDGEGALAASAKRRRRGGTWHRPRRLRHSRAQSSRLRHARPRAGHPCRNASAVRGGGRRARFCAAAHVRAVPALILGSRSASLRLPVDDEAERRRRRGRYSHIHAVATMGAGGVRIGGAGGPPPPHPSSQTPRLSSVCRPYSTAPKPMTTRRRSRLGWSWRSVRTVLPSDCSSNVNTT